VCVCVRARACAIERVHEEERGGKRRRHHSRERVQVFQVWGLRFGLPAAAADVPNHGVCVYTGTQTHTIYTLVPERLSSSKRGVVHCSRRIVLRVSGLGLGWVGFTCDSVHIL